MTDELGRFGHHPDSAIDFCIEVEELEAIAENARLGLTGNGHEADRTTLDSRIERAMDFRVGGDKNCVTAKAGLRILAAARGFDVSGAAAYAGQPMRRTRDSGSDRQAETVQRAPGEASQSGPAGASPNPEDQTHG
jgi:hypothetical protein